MVTEKRSKKENNWQLLPLQRMTQWKTKLATRIWLYETLVKIVLLYNCGTWGVSKDDQRKLNSFQRRQLRKVIRIHWSHKISNNKLYKITHSNKATVDHHNREEMEAAGVHPNTASRLFCKKGDEVLF